ncbi:MAG: hypothetical protein HQL59_13925, partial [Magnetococcales bacterium]|nr:hypothetical protein [Magnetococcales bacterium]
MKPTSRLLVAVADRFETGIVIALAWELSGLFWGVVEPGSRLPPDATLTQSQTSWVTSTRPTNPQAGAGDNPGMAEWHIFGDSADPRDQAQPLQSPPGDADPPATSLDLTLVGLLHRDSTAGGGVAIIRGPGEVERSLAAGETVADGVKIRALLPDRVILEHGGRLESLALPREKSLRRDNPPSRPGFDRAAAAAALVRARDRFAVAPEEVLALVKPAQLFVDGQFRGYRLEPGREPGFLQQLGLEPGDLLEAVNGEPLKNPGQGVAVLEKLSRASAVEIQIRRGGTP